MSVTRRRAEMEDSASTRLGHSPVIVQRVTRVSFVMIRHLVIWAMTHRYSKNITKN